MYVNAFYHFPKIHILLIIIYSMHPNVRKVKHANNWSTLRLWRKRVYLHLLLNHGGIFNSMVYSNTIET